MVKPDTIPYGGALFAIALALTVAFFGFAWIEGEQKLDVTLLTDSALITADPAVSSSLSVQWKGHAVANLRLIEVNVQNGGTGAIRPTDFESPLSLVISNNDSGEFLDANSSAAHPETVDPMVHISGSRRVDIEPVLLNRGDGFSLRLVTTSTQALAVRAEARIADVQNVTLEDGRRLDVNGEPLGHGGTSNWKIVAVIASFFLLLVCAVLVVPSALFSKTDDWSFRGYNVGILAWPAIIGLTVPVYGVTLIARGLSVHNGAVAIWVGAVGLGLVSAIVLISLTARNGRLIGPLRFA